MSKVLVFGSLVAAAALWAATTYTKGLSGVISTQGSKGTAESRRRQPGPCHLSMKNGVVDLQEVSPGSQHQLKYEFSNDGDSDLVVARVASTCGCTVPQLEKLRYRSGEAGCVDVRFTAPHMEGAGEKQLTIWSNDPRHERTELSIKYKIVSPVAIEPHELRLPTLRAGFAVPQVTLISKDRRAFRVTSASSTYNDLTVIFAPNQEGIRHVIAAEVNEARTGKELHGVIRFDLDGIDVRHVYLPYSTLPLYEVTPTQILISNAVKGTSQHRDITIRSNYNTRMEYFGSTSLKNRFAVQEIGEREGELVIRVKPNLEDTTNRFFDDVLRIRFTDGSYVEVNCAGWFAK